jgi:hypothetical protein
VVFCQVFQKLVGYFSVTGFFAVFDLLRTWTNDHSVSNVDLVPSLGGCLCNAVGERSLSACTRGYLN